MKNKKISVRFITILLLSVFTLATFVESYAHAGTNWRTSTCHWWRKKYRATVGIVHWYPPIFGSFPTCGRVTANCGGIIPQFAVTCTDNCGIADAYIFPINSSPQFENEIRKQEQEIRTPTMFPCWLGEGPSDVYADIGKYMGMQNRQHPKKTNYR
jgi:hypothetical protein